LGKMELRCLPKKSGMKRYRCEQELLNKLEKVSTLCVKFSGNDSVRTCVLKCYLTSPENRTEDILFYFVLFYST
jgi:hypothetical protein